jgi:hypothetical protein
MDQLSFHKSCCTNFNPEPIYNHSASYTNHTNLTKPHKTKTTTVCSRKLDGDDDDEVDNEDDGNSRRTEEDKVDISK